MIEKKGSVREEEKGEKREEKKQETEKREALLSVFSSRFRRSPPVYIGNRAETTKLSLLPSVDPIQLDSWSRLLLTLLSLTLSL